MRDFYLVFDDELAFAAAALVREPGLLEIDEVGERHRVVTPAVFSDDGEELSPAVTEPVPGWRVNLRVTDDRDMSWAEPLQVFPARPARVWA